MMSDSPDLDDYVLSHACPACLAPAWVACNIATPDSGPHHRSRLMLGMDHRSSDVANDEDTLPSPHVTDVQTSGIRIIELVDTDLPAGVVTDVSGSPRARGRGCQIVKEVRDGKLVSMEVGRVE